MPSEAAALQQCTVHESIFETCLPVLHAQMQPACPVAPCSLLAENAEAEPAAPLQPEAQVPLLPEDLAVLSVFGERM